MDDLEASLQPLLKTALSETASKLPLLDKAKLYVLVTYAIESMLFSYLRLNGVNAREHQVFKELTRVKQYFDKIKNIETPPVRNTAVDKAAAARFIKAGLAGNDKYDLARAEQIAKERAKSHIKFPESTKDLDKKRKAEVAAEEDTDSSDSDSQSASEAVAKPVVSKKKRKTKSTESRSTSGTSTPAETSKQSEKKAEKSKSSKEGKKATKQKRSKKTKKLGKE
ncbi:related to small unique nuclear receptor co-repressor [Rhynchosporium secalis]|uniref:Exosome complex protein n=1 Tax=Rhynchosporium secalis TaxID=38038 RepID=A0A1E1MPI6_RHYSE|nr:related to small unique nuclear receptor co-repressor [Rhynchosporium secalis]